MTRAPLRPGDVLAGLAGLGLAVCLFALDWFGTQSGWEALSILRFVLLIAAASGVAVAVSPLTQRATAVPVAAQVICMALALLAVLVTAYRLINAPGDGLGRELGAYLGFVAALGLLTGAALSIRDERAPSGEAPSPEPRVVTPASSAAPTSTPR